MIHMYDIDEDTLVDITCSLLIIAYLRGIILSTLLAPHRDEPLRNDITGDTT
jgi:hypothetical protein